MNQGQVNTLRIRVISTGFSVLALAVFKPFGLGAWHLQAYTHLLVIFVLGVFVCLLTDAVMKYIIRMSCNIDDIRRDPISPKTLETQSVDDTRTTGNSINSFIRSNLIFQIINTALEALMICLYRHFVLNGHIGELAGEAEGTGNVLSWSNYFETLAIIAFCSFAIGLYWRFKFRSKYLEAELEETKELNSQLQRMQQELEMRTNQRATDQNLTSNEKSEIDDDQKQLPLAVTLSGTTSETVSLMVPDLLYIEAVGNYVKVYQWRDNQVQADMIRATSKQIEENLRDYPMIVRCHRAFLVNLGQVERIVSQTGSMRLIIKHSQTPIPVSRSNMPGIKRAIVKKEG